MRRMTMALILLVVLSGTVFADGVLDSMAEHLTFLGYEVDSDGESITADRDDAAEIYIEYYDGGVLFWTYWPADKNADWLPFLEAVNDLNYSASASRYYIDEDGDLVIEMWLPDFYDRKLFADSVDLWEYETYGALLSHAVLDFLL